VLIDEVRGAEDEDLAHQVGLLLVAAHPLTGRPVASSMTLAKRWRMTSWNSIRRVER
jgi:hypothetical protein